MAGSRIDTMIAGCPSWEAFRELTEKQKVSKDKGDLFERLTQLYLITSPTYRSKLKNVWWCNNAELPDRVRKKLNLPKDDEGIDLLCETFEGQFWSVQSKYRSNSDKPLTTKELSKFLSLSFVTGKNISYGLIAHTSNKKVQKSHLMGATTEIGLQNWLSITDEQWQQIIDVCKTNSLKPPKKRNPRLYQQKAIDQAKEHFLNKNSKRGKLIMPCGTGKSLIAYWITRKLNVRMVIVAVPSLALVKQSLGDWTSEYLAEGIHPNWIAVCSDDDVGKLKEADSTVATVYETGIPTTTDPSEIVRFLKKKSKDPKVIFTTYQSSKKLADACREASVSVDLLIADEAHKTVGSKNKTFATLLFDDNIKIKKRLFMTATERVYRQGTDNIVSMDDEQVYGSTFHQMSFKQAIADEIICDYKILTVAVAEREVERLISENANVMAQLDNQKVETDSHNLAAGIAVDKVFAKHGIKHAVSFHRSIKRAEHFTKQQATFGRLLGNNGNVENRNVSSKLSTGQRTQVLKDFIEDEKSLITNARCLTEGVDIPAIDCVAFVDPKQSVVDIVQAAGRAMRQSKQTGKTHGYILLPVIVTEGSTLEEFAETSDFKAVIRVLTALSTQDERIAEELRNREAGQQLQAGNINIIDPDIIEALDIDYETFYDGVTTKVWETVGKANWRPFEEARAYVHTLSLSDGADWKTWAKSEKRPSDIPAVPAGVYRNQGWIRMGDWLGTGYIHSNKDWRPFEDAREYVRSLGLTSVEEWRAWARSVERPKDIPAGPRNSYTIEGWDGFPDWLGFGEPQSTKIHLPFEEARTFARSLSLKNKDDWEQWAKSEARPHNIPQKPSRSYKDQGWKGMGDWLGTYERRGGKKTAWRPFEKARIFVRSLNLQSQTEWRSWNKLNKLPKDIPVNPIRVYKDQGWEGMPDWLGYGPPISSKVLRPFEEAREYVRSFGLKSGAEWKSWAKTPNRPKDIPLSPDKSYKDMGWEGMPDWLGYGVPIKERGFLPFEKARTFARSLGIKNKDDWEQWAKSEARPHNIPSNPQYNYKDCGWEGMKDWLGTVGVPPKRRKKFRPFEEARKFARVLDLKTMNDWQEWAASEERPSDIPSSPSLIYKNQGWEGMKDWLGTVDIPHREYRSFDAARSYIHALNLNSKPEWREWCKSGEKPKDIPSNPGKIYLHHGWKGLRDWLGTPQPSKIFRPFKEARNFVQSLNLQCSSEWQKWVKSDHKPIDIPSTPRIAYQDQGWEGMGDWLGTGNASPRGRVYKPYNEARLFIHSLDFKSHTEWREWVKSNQRPADIPSVPARTYKGKGWIDWYDWLGTK